MPDSPTGAEIPAVSVVAAGEALKTAQPELPPLSAPVSELLGRVSEPPSAPSLTADLRAGPAFDDLVHRAVEGARKEGSGRAAAWAVAVVLFALFALRVIFDDVLPKLLMVGTLGLAVAAVVALVSHAIVEARRQRAMLEALEHLTRLAQHDAAMRERIAPQVEALVDALRAPSSLLSFPLRKRA
jgi:hypothetical protein